jgi:hypothetical protein
MSRRIAGILMAVLTLASVRIIHAQQPAAAATVPII